MEVTYRDSLEQFLLRQGSIYVDKLVKTRWFKGSVVDIDVRALM